MYIVQHKVTEKYIAIQIWTGVPIEVEKDDATVFNKPKHVMELFDFLPIDNYNVIELELNLDGLWKMKKNRNQLAQNRQR